MSMSIEDDFYFHFDKNLGLTPCKRAIHPMTLYDMQMPRGCSSIRDTLEK